MFGPQGPLFTAVTRAACVGALALWATGCADLSSKAVELEIYSWWEEESETRAFNRILQEHRNRHPEVRIRSYDDRSGDETRRRVARDMLMRAPPTTFQANIGSDLLRWAAVDYQRENLARSESHLVDLSRFFDRHELWDVIPRELVSELGFEGTPTPGVYAVPINIHRLNVVFFNQARRAEFLATHQVDFTTDLSALCPENSDTPPLPLRIAVGRRSPFVLTLLTFENVLPALAGAAFYDALLRGEAPRSRNGEDWKHDVRRALRCVRYLSRSFVPLAGEPPLDWADAADLVRSGEAAFTVMGDWLNGELASALADGTVASAPFPGTERLWVFTSDTFPLPRYARNHPEVEELLGTIALPEVQRLFSAEKGSIPARRDVALDGPDSDRRAAFEQSETVVATSGLFPPYFPSRELEDQLAAMVDAESDGAIEPVIEWFSNVSSLLSRWQHRLKRGAGEANP